MDFTTLLEASMQLGANAQEIVTASADLMTQASQSAGEIAGSDCCSCNNPPTHPN